MTHPVVGAALAAAAVSVLAVWARSEVGGGTLETLERNTLDLRFSARGPTPTSGELAVVTFDDDTVARGGPLLERRAGWARVIGAVKAAGARTIGIDAAFDVPERLLDHALAARVREWAQAHGAGEAASPEALLLAEVAKELNGDAELEAALRDAGNTVLIFFADEGGAREDPGTLSRARYGQSSAGGKPPAEVSTVVASLARFNAQAKGVGFASVREDSTRTVRRVGFALGSQGSVFMPFTAAAFAVHRGLSRGRVAYLGAQQEVRLGDTRLALQDDSVWLNYRGHRGTFPTFSAVDVAEGRAPPGALKDKLVLIGVTRLGYDITRTPFEDLPGVEVQATAIDNLLRGDMLRRSPRLVDLALALAVGLLIAALFSTRRLGLVAQAAGTVVVLGGWALAAQLLFERQHLWVPVVGPLLSGLTASVVGLTLSYASEALQRRTLRKAFAQYLGEDALAELLKTPGALALGGERKELSVLFSDICDFTTLSERLKPEALVQFLNTYLSPMTRAVLTQGGLLDKYIGDAVMAVFGAPVPRSDHPVAALTCALQMHRELEALNAGPLKALGLDIAIGVGVNTGEMVVGNMGSAERFDYTVAGDAVNLASRLEGLTRTYGVFCVAGARTRELGGAAFSWRALDLVQVKGKKEPVAIFELLGGPDRTVARYDELAHWETAVAAWREGRLDDARPHFDAFAKANPRDKVARLYVERLAALPGVPPEGWQPIAVFKTK